MNMWGRLSTTIALGAMLAFAAPGVRAQTPQPRPVTPPVESLYADAVAKEAAVRKALVVPSPAPTVLRAVRTVVGDFENVVRRYPASSYSDDALWRGGQLAKDAFNIFADPRERSDAQRLLQLLASEYPTSRFARQVPAQIAALGSRPAGPPVSTTPRPVPPANPAPAAPGQARPAPTATPLPPANTADADAPGAPRLTTIKAIRRAVLKDVVRVVIELDTEVAFHDERLDSPSRVFVDLPGTRANAALIDQTLRFDADADLVRQIRIGRHPNNVTRVVLEAAGVSSYSVYPLYSPYRLVIDCLRADASIASAPAAVLPPQSSPAAQPAVRRAAPSDPPGPREAASIAPAPSAVLPDRPSWATRLQATAPAQVASIESVSSEPITVGAPPPLPPAPIAARAVRWVTSLPRMTARPLPPADPGTTPAPVGPVQAASLPPAPAVAAPPPAPAPPSRNLAGGLSIARQLGLGVSRIVIDPGHGGHDPGAKGPGVTEAELVLDVALRLEKLLAKLNGVEVVLTRRGDEFIPLQERTAIANREGADLFLSIHANASNVPAARGVETYFLDFASNQGAAAVAARENSTSGQTMAALEDVVKAITLNNKLDESRDFATYVHREMLGTLRTSNTTLKDLGVKRAPFVVLVGASMPSILAEVSFITNPQEAKLLKSQNYRQKIAQALFEGVKKYQLSLKTAPSLTQQQ